MSDYPNREAWFSGGQMACDNIPPRGDRPYRLVLLGPPGVGKGTQAELLCQTLRTCHLSTGDLFRAAKCQGATSPAMNAAQEAVRRGELVSDDLMIRMVWERASCLNCGGGILLDGFPRNLHQAEALDGMFTVLGTTLDAVLCFELPLTEIVSRLAGRRTCDKCRAVFHVTAQPPAVPDGCDHCGGPLVQRDDDRPEAIRVRMHVYEAETQPLIEFYARAGNLVRISADGTPEEIHERTLLVLAQYQATRAKAALTA